MISYRSRDFSRIPTRGNKDNTYAREARNDRAMSEAVATSKSIVYQVLDSHGYLLML